MKLQVGSRSLKISHWLHFILLISVALSFLGPVVLALPLSCVLQPDI